MKSLMSKHHQRTYDAIFQHHVTHGLHWRDVTAMLGGLAEVIEERNGNLKATRNGHTLVLHASPDKSVMATEELMVIRHFLERSDDPVKEAPEDGRRILVMIDHREARIYKAEPHGEVPHRIAPFDPHGFGRSLHYNQDHSNGQRKPELKGFYEAVAKTLQGADEILLFGTGTGASSAMNQLLADLKLHHHDLAERVVGSIVVDEHHLTEDQLLAEARKFYEKRGLSNSEN